MTRKNEMEEEKLEPRLEVISQIKQVRKEQHITQEALAERAGTKKSNISRLESGKYNPSLDFLIRVAGQPGEADTYLDGIGRKENI